MKRRREFNHGECRDPRKHEEYEIRKSKMIVKCSTKAINATTTTINFQKQSRTYAYLIV